MKKILVSFLLLHSVIAFAGGRGDDPMLTMAKINQIEWRETDQGDAAVVEADAWLGKDLNKFWLKVDVERMKGNTDDLELQFLYSRAIAAYWDLQIGWRHDHLPSANRDWLTVGFQGLAAYFFEIDSALFIGEGGQAALRIEAEYEVLLTQRLILMPELEVNIYSKYDADLGLGSGLSDVALGLRLRYEITREFAPYIGINWVSKYGKTADLAKDDGESVRDTQFVVGVRAWF